MVLKGIFPVIPTLFTNDDSLDLEGIAKVVQFALESGAHGLVYPGVASEYNHLSTEERAQGLEQIVREAQGKVPIIAGASAHSVEGTIAAGRQAAEHGIRHLMILAPGNLGNDNGAQEEFLTTAITALPAAEIILQNAPKPVGAGLSAETLVDLVAARQAITYVKEETLPSGPAISHLRAASLPGLKGIFGGGGARYIIDELDRGAVGAMPAVELTDLHVKLYEAHTDGDHEQARSLYGRSLPLLVSQAVYRMRLTKHILSRRGIASAPRVRAPLPEFDEATVRDLDQMLADLKDVLS